MCGILGVRRTWCSDRAAIESALASLRWRGRDAARLVDVGEFTIGVARLSISDPHSEQPVVSQTSGRVVAFNGAVTSAALDRARFAGQLRSGNDAELLLHRFAADGAASLLRMTGPYAFALVDPGTDELWLGRDPFGEKPLHVVCDARGVVAFASDLGALRALGLSFELDPDTRARSFRFGFGATVRCTTPGLELGSEPFCLARDGGDGRGLQPVAAAGGLEPVDSTTPLVSSLQAACLRCADAEPPVALALSGGIDSAVIAAVLAGSGRRLPGYQCAFGGADPAERGRAHAAAQRLGIELREVDVGAEVLTRATTLAECAAQPIADPSILVTHALARAVAADGIRVLLSGEGADELLLGYPRLRALAAIERWPRLARVLSAVPMPALSMSRTARMVRAARSPTPHQALLEVAPRAFRAAVLVPELTDASLPEGGASDPRGLELEHYLRSDLLPKFDVAALTAQVEGRCPFLDPQFARHAMDLPHAAVAGKRHLREAFAQRLPAGHFDQPKRGFAVPIDRFWRDEDFLADVLTDRRTLERGHLRADGVRRMLQLQRLGRVRLGHALWTLVADELWHRAHVDDQPGAAGSVAS